MSARSQSDYSNKRVHPIEYAHRSCCCCFIIIYLFIYNLLLSTCYLFVIYLSIYLFIHLFLLLFMWFGTDFQGYFAGIVAML